MATGPPPGTAPAMPPPGAPPLGPLPPNDDRGAAVLGVDLSFVIIAVLLVCVRMYVRARIVKSVGLDDLFIVLATSIAIAVAVLTGLAVHDGLGRHVQHLAFDNATKALEYFFVIEVISMFTLMFSKLSIGFFLLRFFQQNRNWRWALWGTMALSTITCLLGALITLFQCNPIKKTWNPFIAGECRPQAANYAAHLQGVVSLLTDFVLALLPVLFLWKVQMKKRIKVVICILMGLGIFTGIFAIARTVLLSDLNNNDLTWSLVPLSIFATLESLLSIIAATIPTIQPLFRKRMPIKPSYETRSWATRPSRPIYPQPEIDEPRGSGWQDRSRNTIRPWPSDATSDINVPLQDRKSSTISERPNPSVEEV